MGPISSSQVGHPDWRQSSWCCWTHSDQESSPGDTWSPWVWDTMRYQCKQRMSKRLQRKGLQTSLSGIREGFAMSHARPVANWSSISYLFVVMLNNGNDSFHTLNKSNKWKNTSCKVPSQLPFFDSCLKLLHRCVWKICSSKPRVHAQFSFPQLLLNLRDSEERPWEFHHWVTLGCLGFWLARNQTLLQTWTIQGARTVPVVWSPSQTASQILMVWKASNSRFGHGGFD